MTKQLISTHDLAILGASASIDITSGIDSNFSVYEFHFLNCHPANDSVWLTFQVNAYDPSAGTPQLTGFNETTQSSYFRAYHYESGSASAFQYQTSSDQALGTAYQRISTNAGNDNDQSVSGVLTLYDPLSTDYVKHFLARTNSAWASDGSFDTHAAGYINTANAITQISFKFSSGNIDAGVIKMFGVT